jgi:Family of unknown function (DUF6252)
MLKKFWHLFVLSGMLIAVGCSQAVAPTELNPGIPPGAKEGEYGYNINGKGFDSGTPVSFEGSAQLSPYPGQSAGAVILHVLMSYDFTNGQYGTIQFTIPLTVPKPQSLPISNSGMSVHATAIYDSMDDIIYEALPGGTINITKFDTVNNLVSGTFEFTASESYPKTDPQMTATITSGYLNDMPIGEGAYGQGSIVALLNGTPFNSDTAGLEMVSTDSSFGGINLFDYGQEMNNDSFISIQRIPLRTGTYEMDSSTARKDSIPIIIFQNWGNLQRNASTQSAGSSGILTITSCDIAHRRISGTFQFSGIDSLGNTVSITNGVINNVLWNP